MTEPTEALAAGLVSSGEETAHLATIDEYVLALVLTPPGEFVIV